MSQPDKENIIFKKGMLILQLKTQKKLQILSTMVVNSKLFGSQAKYYFRLHVL